MSQEMRLIRCKSHRARGRLPDGIGTNLFSFRHSGEFYAVTVEEYERLKTVKGIGRAIATRELVEALQPAWSSFDTPEAEARRKEAQRRLEALKLSPPPNQTLPMSARTIKTRSMSSEDEEKRGRGRPPIDNPATHHIHMRVTPRRKSAYVKAAHPQPLATWIEKHLDKAAREAGQEPEPKD